MLTTATDSFDDRPTTAMEVLYSRRLLESLDFRGSPTTPAVRVDQEGGFSGLASLMVDTKASEGDREAFEILEVAEAAAGGSTHTVHAVPRVDFGVASPLWRLPSVTVADVMLACAKEPQTIAGLVRSSGNESVADEIERLLALADDDPDEPEMQLESLRELALFLLHDNWLPSPVVGVSHEGLLTAEWRIVPSGGLIMTFVPPGRIQFAGVADVGGSGTGFRSEHGIGPQSEALGKIRSFASGFRVI